VKVRCLGTAVAVLSGFLCLAGCLALIRRPGPDTARVPAWAPPGERAAAGPDTAGAGLAGFDRGYADPRAAPRAAPATPVPRPERDARHRRDLKALNEYVHWCIGQDMWNEARLHLEKALQQDSLAASLHNNLGIVYERLGDSARAAAAYQRARLLNPRNRAYNANLELLGKRRKAESGVPPEARPDSAVIRALVPALEADSAGAPPRPPNRYTR